jgi:hypothetical protein
MNNPMNLFECEALAPVYSMPRAIYPFLYVGQASRLSLPFPT